jgi:transporter family protein
VSVTWLVLALISTAVSAAVNTFDSHFLTRRMPSLRSYLAIIGAFTILIGAALLVIFPLPVEAGLRPLAAAVASALLRVVAVFMLLYAMTQDDVSRVIPLNSTAPVFVAVMAAIFLGERLTLLQWLAIVVVVLGAVLISFKKTGSSARFQSRSFFMVIGSALFFAAGDVTNKYALNYYSYLNTGGIMLLITSAVFLLVCVRRPVIQEIKSLKRPVATTVGVILNQIAAVIATLLAFWAIDNGPVSLASTIFNSKPLFVFILAVSLAWLVPGFLPDNNADKQDLRRKFMATLLIVGGLAMIVLG